MQLDSAFSTKRQELSISGVSRITRPSQAALVVQRRRDHLERAFKVAIAALAAFGAYEFVSYLNFAL